MKKTFLLFLFCCFFFLPVSSFAFSLEPAPFKTNFFWVSAQNRQVLCIELIPLENNYTYAPNQENVYPTAVKFDGKISRVPLLFPQGKPKNDVVTGLNVLVYDKTVRIYAVFPQKANQGKLEVSFLACSEKRCRPFSVQKNMAEIAETDFSAYKYKNDLYNLLYAHEQNVLPKEQLSFSGEISSKPQIAETVPMSPNKADKPDLAAFSLDALQKRSAADEGNAESGEIADAVSDTGNSVYEFQVRPYQQEFEVRGVAKALLFGLLAGFILNFMPCVLPIAALKIHSFLGVRSESDISRFRRQMLFFACGILVWFLVLAVLIGLLGFTWGQLFQEYWVMLFMCTLVFVLALSLFEVFHLPVMNLHRAEGKNVRLDAFLSGFLATVLATPCSGPLLGGVLGYSLTQPIHIVLLIFFFMGLGMAFPYLLFYVKPGFVRFMPKAGTWLLAMERILAFFLVGTALYLFSLLPETLYLRTLIFLFVLTVCLYVWGKWASLHLAAVRRKAAGFVLCGIAVLCFWVLYIVPLNREHREYWQAFDNQAFLRDLGEKTLVLKFTADWCPTCKVLEKTVFTEENMQKLSDQSVQFVLVDMTRFSEQTQNLLTSLESASIPLLAVFPKNNPNRPYIVRDVYTFSTVWQVLQKAMIE